MHMLLVGATGAIGSQILEEAVRRGHRVVAVSRHADTIAAGPQVEPVAMDARDTERLVMLARGQDAIVAALSPRGDDGRERYLGAIRSVLRATKEADVPYVLFIGGMSNLFTADGRRLIDVSLETTPREQLAGPLAVAEARAIIEASDVPWTFLCPGGQVVVGERTARFRVGGEQALFELGDDTRISRQDLAVAAVDELERQAYPRQLFHVLY